MRIWREKAKRDGRAVTLWCADFTLRGTRYRPREESKDALDEVIETIRSRARQRRYGLPEERATITIRELVAERISDPNFRNQVRFKAGKRTLIEFRDFNDFGERAVESLTPTDVRDFVRHKRGGLKPSTLNRELGFISACLRQAGKYFAELESWKPPALPYATEDEGRSRVLAEDEARRLITHLRAGHKDKRRAATNRDVADLLQLALLTGMRKGEWRMRTWAQVDFEADVVRLTHTKTRRPRTLPMGGAVRAILLRRHAARCNGSPYIFPSSRKPAQPRGETSIRYALRDAARELGITYGRDVEGGFVFHDTRHTAVTSMLDEGNDLATVGDISGHSKKTMVLRYSHATLKSRRRAVESLEKFNFSEPPDKKLTEDSEGDGQEQAVQQDTGTA